MQLADHMDRERFIYSKKWSIAWLFKMAWRDSRVNRFRLLLFISSITMGIAALVATFSLGDNVLYEINRQAKTLVGADLSIENSRPVSAALKQVFDTMGEKRSEERTFASMIYFPKNQGTRLVQVRALQGDYPFYGSLETQPASASINFRKDRQALVDKTLMLQFDAKPGDSIKIGELNFAIAGVLEKAPGRTNLSTTVAPPVYIPLQYLKQTGLIQKGSRFSYNYYFKYKSQVDIDNIVSGIRPKLEKEGADYDTVEERKRNSGRAFEDFNRFLTLISFIALLLGCIGVAGSVHFYIREKINSISILRCLGANGSQAFLIWLIQVCCIGLIGSITGAAFGIVVQQLLPQVFKDVLPIELSTPVSWPSLAKGILTGMCITGLFALLPLLPVRRISPLLALRISIEQSRSSRDLLKWIVYTLILLFITLFTWWQMRNLPKAIVFTLSIAFAFAILAATGGLLKWMLRRFFPDRWSFLWRQGLANLHRPNNQTLILICTIGLGAVFISTLYFVQGILINRVSMTGSGAQPNMVLFDIQTDQKQPVADLARQFQLPIVQQVPIVTMRIEEVNGKNAEEVKKDTTSRVPRRLFDNELRVTYRDTLTSTEKLTKGELGKHVRNESDSIYVSLDQRYAEWVHLQIGDHIVFNVQGKLIPAIVGSFREVDWRRVQTNFRIIFPTGVLEKAPQFHVLITRVPSPEVSAKFQQAVVQRYPNISVIDLGLILSVLEDLLDKIGFVIRFMAGFSIITGMIVLISSVLISKYQRIQESVLLRTLGASRKQILVITGIEYFLVGGLAASAGILLAMAASWGLAKYVFDAPFHVQVWPLVFIFLAISLTTVIIGLFNSRDVLQKTPLEVLRQEV